ncbi:MAG: UDP-3-O-(3-hydroxymyristoyl)glucosamine N-acyltransferase [Chitinophagales bacterium]|nr:UDP-3-O-(3-hydroxymyristoyl)glucosamine N-acyltransferase [Chitinophagales bacterium]
MISVQTIAEKVGAQVIGDSQQIISRPNRIEFAQEGEISFIQHAKYLPLLSECKASAILTTSQFVDTKLPFTWLVVDNSYFAFAAVIDLFLPSQKPDFSHHTLFFIEKSAKIASQVQIGHGTYIGKETKIGEESVIYPQVYIGNHVQIGSNVMIYPGVKIMDNSIIGNDCIIHAGAVIGSDGFGFVVGSDGVHQKIPHKGNVILEDHVEIGANTCIDRAVLGSTIIKSGVKLDNLIQIGHNVQIGANTVIAAQTGVAGSCQIGENNQIGGQVGIAPHLLTAKDVKINGQSGLTKSVLTEGATMTGTPAQLYMEYNRSQVLRKKIEADFIQKKNKE